MGISDWKEDLYLSDFLFSPLHHIFVQLLQCEYTSTHTHTTRHFDNYIILFFYNSFHGFLFFWRSTLTQTHLRGVHHQTLQQALVVAMKQEASLTVMKEKLWLLQVSSVILLILILKYVLELHYSTICYTALYCVVLFCCAVPVVLTGVVYLYWSVLYGNLRLYSALSSIVRYCTVQLNLYQRSHILNHSFWSSYQGVFHPILSYGTCVNFFLLVNCHRSSRSADRTTGV